MSRSESRISYYLFLCYHFQVICCVLLLSTITDFMLSMTLVQNSSLSLLFTPTHLNLTPFPLRHASRADEISECPLS